MDWERTDKRLVREAVESVEYTAGGANFLGVHTRALREVREPSSPPWLWCLWQMESQSVLDTFGDSAPARQYVTVFEIHRQKDSGDGYATALVGEIRSALSIKRPGVTFLWKRGRLVPIGDIGGAHVMQFTVPTWCGVQ